MSFTRRDFVRTSALAGAAAGLGACSSGDASDEATPAADPLRVLILGGTGWLGPNQVRTAVGRGHEVTLFNRGRRNPGMFPELETLIGDRNDNLESLRGRTWDVVIDNSATIPRWVRQSTEVLGDSVGAYVFVSSVGVYLPYLTAPLAEDGPVGTIDDPTTEEVNGATYGALKALSEEVARQAYPDTYQVVRPGYIVGPEDPTDRFTYWPVRMARGGEMLAPGSPSDPIQQIDVRDLATFMIDLVEQRATGTFNAVGPRESLSMARFLESVGGAVESEAELTWVDADFLEERDVSFLTYWAPPRGDYLGMHQIDGSKAFAHGLRSRPIAETASDTLDWFNTLDEERRAELRSGIPADREADILAAWAAR
ncbi:MAG: twin-arginine translocation signal domain-containing protein [Gemmatimonadota bacterium]|nr:twin-arginine translocation signal domain-containing protein [Gemmatimonadota bacterium]